MAKNKPPAKSMSIEDTLRAVAPAENWSLVDDLAQEVGIPLVVLYIGEGYLLQPPLLKPFYDILESVGKVESLALLLRSTGGITEVPWKIVSLLKEYSKDLTVLVPEVAHSGATHIALAADTLIMTELSTLSSVDPTRRHPLLPKDKDGNPIHISVQDLKHCVDFIKGQLGEKSSGSDIATIIGELFSHVHPLSLGAIEQSAELSKLITRKVLATRQQALSSEHVEKIVNQLAGKYFSHAFQISRNDVKKDLDLPVSEPSQTLKSRMEALLHYYEQEAKSVGKGQVNSKPVTIIQAVFLDSQKLRKIGYALIDGTRNPIGILWKTIQKGASHAAKTPGGPSQGQAGGGSTAP